MSRPTPFELAVPISATDHVLGPEHAPLTVLEYGDFECPNCMQAAPAIKMILKRFENRIRFAYRHFPLEEIHPRALAAAEAAECAGAQGKFWQMHDLLFESIGKFSDDQLLAYAKRMALDMALFTAEMDDEVYRQRVREHQAGGRTSGVRATPTFFINGKLFDVSYGIHTLADAVAAALK
ncbi:MAG TPA: DsbA family protein [Steroidobacteraceae bacterium]